MCNIARGRKLNHRGMNERLDRNYFESFDGILMDIFMMNGFKMCGYINDLDDEAILITEFNKNSENERPCLLYKTAISTIKPSNFTSD